MERINPLKHSFVFLRYKWFKCVYGIIIIIIIFKVVEDSLTNKKKKKIQIDWLLFSFYCILKLKFLI